MSEDKSKDYKLERYKFILQQLNSLNESSHKYIALFQTLATAILGAGFAIFAALGEKKISADTTRLGAYAILWLFTLLTFFVLVSIIVNAVSWFDYRKEEVELLSSEVHEDFRKMPSWKNSWRWGDTYFALSLLLILIIVWVYATFWLIPTIK